MCLKLCKTFAFTGLQRLSQRSSMNAWGGEDQKDIVKWNLLNAMKGQKLRCLHFRELWGYSKEENLASDDLHKVTMIMMIMMMVVVVMMMMMMVVAVVIMMIIMVVVQAKMVVVWSINTWQKIALTNKSLKLILKGALCWNQTSTWLPCSGKYIVTSTRNTCYLYFSPYALCSKNFVPCIYLFLVETCILGFSLYLFRVYFIFFTNSSQTRLRRQCSDIHCITLHVSRYCTM